MNISGVVVALALAGLPEALAGQARPDTLSGLWNARGRFGPDVRGTLIIERRGNTYTAMIASWTLPVREEQGELSFTLPDGRGAFRGKPWPGGGIRGFWFPERTLATGGHVIPVRLSPRGANRWVGEVTPIDDVFSFYLLLRPRPDGVLGAFLRNAERDWGAPFGIDRLVRQGASLKLIARGQGQAADREISDGWYDAESDILSLRFPGRGGTFDFRRAGDGSNYYPRNPRLEPYTYRPPPALEDGWRVAPVDSVGIDRTSVEAFIRILAGMGMDSVNAPQVHAVLIARHGRLVLEEYFHGENRFKTHDTRSGSKSVVSILVGAAMQAGLPVRLSTPVYQTMLAGSVPGDLDPRKRAMTLQHLLSMSSGFFCDDSNDQAPGSEEKLWNGEEPDAYRFMLNTPMANAPGEEKGFYCSGVANLALGVLSRAVSESPYYLFERLVAEPLRITRYGWIADRVKQAYGGGAMQFLTRDYLKLGQLMLNGGIWEGRRILSRESVNQITRIHSTLGSRRRGYGQLWWVEEYPFRGRTIKTFASLGLGGQLVIVFPELDMVVATQGGSYSSTGWRYLGGELIPRYILPAVR